MAIASCRWEPGWTHGSCKPSCGWQGAILVPDIDRVIATHVPGVLTIEIDWREQTSPFKSSYSFGSLIVEVHPRKFYKTYWKPAFLDPAFLKTCHKILYMFHNIPYFILLLTSNSQEHTIILHHWSPTISCQMLFFTIIPQQDYSTIFLRSFQFSAAHALNPTARVMRMLSWPWPCSWKDVRGPGNHPGKRSKRSAMGFSVVFGNGACKMRLLTVFNSFLTTSGFLSSF